MALHGTRTGTGEALSRQDLRHKTAQSRIATSIFPSLSATNTAFGIMRQPLVAVHHASDVEVAGDGSQHVGVVGRQEIPLAEDFDHLLFSAFVGRSRPKSSSKAPPAMLVGRRLARGYFTCEVFAYV